MAKRNDSKDDLRRRAEATVSEKLAALPDAPTLSSAEELRNLVHELQVHQVELEMQNEALREAQFALQEAHDKYIDLYDYAPVGYLTADNKGIINEANLTATHLLGVDRVSLIGRPISRFVFKDDLDTCYLKLQQVFATQEKQTCELRFVKENGDQFYAQLEGRAVQDHDGKITRARIILSDISERKWIENELRDRDRVYRTLSENIPGIVYRVHLDEPVRMEFFNSMVRSITGFSEDELTIGEICSIDPMIISEDRPRIMEIVKNSLADDKPFEVEYRIRHKNGEIRNLLEYGRPIIGLKGSHSYIDGVIVDITERKKFEAEKSNLIIELQKALAQVKKLSGFLPICASCKKIRDDKGYWKQVEEYISDHSEALFSHGICPDCMRSLYPEIADDVLGRLNKNEKK